MIKINLLPEEQKKEQKPKASFNLEIPKLGPRLLKLAISLLSVLIGLHFLLAISILTKGLSLKALDSKWQYLQPNKSEVERINSEIANIEKTVSPVRQLIDKRISWAKELNELGNLMTTGVWLTKLFIETQMSDVQKGEYLRILNLEGRAASLYGDETALVAKFVKALQQNKEFFQYFSEVKLGPMEKSVLEKSTVMNFKIFCVFKKKD